MDSWNGINSIEEENERERERGRGRSKPNSLGDNMLNPSFFF